MLLSYQGQMSRGHMKREIGNSSQFIQQFRFSPVMDDFIRRCLNPETNTGVNVSNVAGTFREIFACDTNKLPEIALQNRIRKIAKEEQNRKPKQQPVNLHNNFSEEELFQLMRERTDWYSESFLDTYNMVLDALGKPPVSQDELKVIIPEVLKKEKEFIKAAATVLKMYHVPYPERKVVGNVPLFLVYPGIDDTQFVKEAAVHARYYQAPFYVNESVYKWLKAGKELPADYKLVPVDGNVTNTNPENMVALKTEEYNVVINRGNKGYETKRIADIAETVSRFAEKRLKERMNENE